MGIADQGVVDVSTRDAGPPADTSATLDVVASASKTSCAGTLLCDHFEYAEGGAKKAELAPNWGNANNVIQDTVCPHSNTVAQSKDAHVVSSPARSGSGAMRIDIDACDTCMRSGPKWRTELKSAWLIAHDKAYWVGFSLLLPASFIDDGRSEIIMQIHGAEHRFNIHTHGGGFRTTVHWPGGQKEIDHTRGKVFDAWIDFKVSFKLNKDGGGFARIYRRDEGQSAYTQVLGYSGKLGKSSSASYLKLGLYKWSWTAAAGYTGFDPSKPPSCGAGVAKGVTHRTVYFDSVKVATSDQAVEP